MATKFIWLKAMQTEPIPYWRKLLITHIYDTLGVRGNRKKIAKAIGVTETTLSAMVNKGKCVQTDHNLKKMEEFYDVPLEKLKSITDDKPIPKEERMWLK